jgi:hypothetical protein
MNKKLMVVAVASALAVPGLALAQASSVTISGIFKVGVDQVSYSGASQSTVAPGALGPVRRTGNSNETRLSTSPRVLCSAFAKIWATGLRQSRNSTSASTLPPTALRPGMPGLR